MVLKSYATLSSTSGLLPTPSTDPLPGLHPNNYIESSLFLIPYQAVVVLQGCQLADLLSWDLAPSAKSVKAKIKWSSDPKSSSNFKLCDKLPTNLVKGLCLYDLSRPLWSMSSSPTKITCRFEWSVSSSVLTSPSNISPSINQKLPPVSSNSPKTPHQTNNPKPLDSGYQSFYLTVGCHGPKFKNWRLNHSPVSQPKFTPSPSIKKNYVFKPSSKQSEVPRKIIHSESKEKSINSDSTRLINSESSLTTPEPITKSHTSKVVEP